MAEEKENVKEEESKKEDNNKDVNKEEKEEEKKEEGKEEDKKDENKDEEEVEVPEKFKGLVEEIEKMSVLDLAELVKVLEKKFGVSASAQVVAAAPMGGQPAGGGEGGAEEKSSFTVELKAVGDKKIEVIKLVRDLMGKGLKEAKDLVDAVANGPQVIKENVKKEEAEELKKKFEAAGATVELK